MSDVKMEEAFANKALADGAFAIAYALMRLTDAQFATARALNRLGNGNASTDFGAIEALGMQVRESANALDRIASSISEMSLKIRD